MQSKTTNSAQSSSFNSKSNQQTKNNQHSAGRKSSCKNAAKYDSIAALTDIMDYSSTNITIPASGSALVQKSDRDPDADTSSTKTEVEEMELDQLSDLEDNLRAHENVRILKSIKVQIFRKDNKNLKKLVFDFTHRVSKCQKEW